MVKDDLEKHTSVMRTLRDSIAVIIHREAYRVTCQINSCHPQVRVPTEKDPNHSALVDNPAPNLRSEALHSNLWIDELLSEVWKNHLRGGVKPGC